MIPQNDPLDEADDPRPKFFDRLIPINRFLDPLPLKMASFGQNSARFAILLDM